MGRDIRVGDCVKLLGLPDWLIHDLPPSEQVEMRQFVGQTGVVSQIDEYGYFWLGFGSTHEAGESAYYSGHSFGVPREFLQLDGE
jgi:hypothetical protein